MVDQGEFFHKFFRGDYRLQDPENSFGLALVKNVTDLHEVDIQLVDTNPSVSFLITFPFSV